MDRRRRRRRCAALVSIDSWRWRLVSIGTSRRRRRRWRFPRRWCRRGRAWYPNHLQPASAPAAGSAPSAAAAATYRSVGLECEALRSRKAASRVAFVHSHPRATLLSKPQCKPLDLLAVSDRPLNAYGRACGARRADLVRHAAARQLRRRQARALRRRNASGIAAAAAAAAASAAACLS